MNFKTTLALLIVIAAGAVLFWSGTHLPPALDPAPKPAAVADAGTRGELESWRPEAITRIEVIHGDRVTALERTGEKWNLPGNWPTRKAEVDALVNLLASLHSRFEPRPIVKDTDLAACGLDRPALSVKVKVGPTDHVLLFGEAATTDDPATKVPFERPTYVRLDDKPEAVQLAPGLIGLLDRPTDYYQQRRLFDSVRVAREDDPQEKVEKLPGRKGETVSLHKEAKDKEPKEDSIPLAIRYDGTEWVLTQPGRDHPEARALEALLTAVPDIWAENFVQTDRSAVAAALAAPQGDLASTAVALSWLHVTTPSQDPRWLPLRCGLLKPERKLAVTDAAGKTLTLLIGDVSGSRTRTEFRPPPGGPPGMRLPPQEITTVEEYRYARLDDEKNKQIFEIKGDRLKDVFVTADTLRDPHVARFNTADVQRVELLHDGQVIEAKRDGTRWKLVKPIETDADADKIDKLLRKLSDLESRGKDVSYTSDDKTTGLDKPTATVTLTVEEPIKNSPDKAKKSRTLTVELGKKAGTRVYVKARSWPRISHVEDGDKEEDSLVFLASRDVLAYRGKRLFDFKTEDLVQITINQGDKVVALKQDLPKWTLTEPVAADADSAKAMQLAGSLSGLEVLEYVNDAVKPDQLEPQFGLGKPELTVKLIFKDNKKPQILEIGKARGEKPGYFARLADGKSVFAVANDIHQTLSRDSLAWRSKRLLDFTSDELAKLTIKHGDQAITLEQQDKNWRLTSPTSSDVDKAVVTQLVNSLAVLEAVEYVSNKVPADQLDPDYGLGKSALSVELTVTDKKKPVKKLQIGKQRSGKPGYFGRLDESPAVFAVNPEIHNSLSRDALALLPLQLWQLMPGEVTAVKIHKRGSDEYRLTRKDAGWQISGPFEAAALSVRADRLTTGLLAPRCESYKAFDSKDPALYGLDKPELEITLTAKDGKEHGLVIGAPVGKDSPGRFARKTGSPAVFVVGETVLGAADKSALDLLDPVLLRLEPNQLERVQDKTGTEMITLEKKGEGWQVLDSPAGKFDADIQVTTEMDIVWQNVVAEKFAAYGPKVDLAMYGLDKPETTLTIKVGKPDMKEHTLELGKSAGMEGGRYARLDKGPGVAVLPTRVAAVMTRGYLDYVNRNVLKFDPGAVTMMQRQAGTDALEVARRDGNWFLVKPAEERADDRAMQSLLQQLAELRAQRVVAFPAKDLKTYGLDTPTATVKLTLEGDAKPDNHTVKIGKVADAMTGDLYAVIDDSKAVVVLPAQVTRPLLAGVLGYRDRTLAKFAQADVLRLERDRRKAVFANIEGTWKLTEPLQAEADQADLDDFVNKLARLRADELVVEKATADDLKKYGLDKPEARWRIQSGDKDVLDLVIGSHEKDSTRRYARLGSRDIVFLLDAPMSAKVLAEYRPRTVWTPSIDASQVEALRFGYARNPFVLEKLDASWQVVGKENVKLTTETVNETLATLAGLKLMRYVMDKDADLQLYGLKTPELVLEVHTRSGKRTLQIGAREGDSERRYAHIAEGGRTDVFVISERDAAKLLRDVAAFSRPVGLP
jgi:hypothetical protein